MEHIERLKNAIRHLHGAEPSHVESVPITEQFNGETIWQGIVEVFDLVGHPKTGRVYAWSHETDNPADPERHVTVLHIPPVVSPIDAVRAAILEEFRSLGKAAEA